MRIGIISDSHDNITAIESAVTVLNKEGVDLTIHLGDIISPFCFDYLNDLKMPFIGVFGNNDGELLYLQERSKNRLHKPPYEAEFDNKKFLLMHEPIGIDKICDNYDYCLYGHTHHIDIKKTKSGFIINPGELCGYLTKTRTLIVMDTQKNNITKIIV